MTEVPERDEARRALTETRASSAATGMLVTDARAVLEQARGIHRENHFTDKFRRIIQGIQ
jgi:hypothetical protein